MTLPPGQRARDDFPRFGLPPYADRFPSDPRGSALAVEIDGGERVVLDPWLADLPRTKLTADFHCVTTWSVRDLEWGGVRFVDFYRERVEPLTGGAAIGGAVFCAQDGYRTAMAMEDLLAGEVLLADTLGGEPLGLAHGAPLRLVAPAHYGYKNLKHLKRIEFHTEVPRIKRGIRAFLDHPRARVREEERGRWVPGPLLRWVYRPLIASTARRFASALERHLSQS